VGGSQPVHWWRWFPTRLSVRVLLATVLVLGCGLGWAARLARLADAQREAVAVISRAGGEVETDEKYTIINQWSWSPRGSWWPGWLVGRLGRDLFFSVTWVKFREASRFFANVSDADLAYVGRLRKLEVLVLRGTGVTDAGLAHHSGLPRLRFLNLSQTKVSDAGLAHLARLTALERLDLTGTDVTGAGVERLQAFLPKTSIAR
jgi:hypothetical protein